jgi:pimeloyl-ACP methyl ester carboxylesterase
MRESIAWVLFACVAGLGCAEPPDAGSPEPADDVGSVEASLGSAPRVPDEVHALARRSGALSEEELDRVYELHHDVWVGPHRRVHLVEHFSVRSWVSWPRRGALLLPGTIVTSSFYDIDVDGYRFAEDLAREGFFVFAMDYEGSGESTYPEDGSAVTHEYLVDSARRVLPYIRLLRWIPRVDAIGESNGGAIAAELCADARRVRSCVMSSMLYTDPTPFLESVFLDPGFLAFLRSQPNGYLDVTPDLYFNITSRTSPEVTAEILATQPGVYAVEPLLAPVELPWFDPTRAEVPGLIIQGTEDNIATQADADLLAAAYGSAPGAGGTATVVRIEGAGHLPRVEPGANTIWTSAVLDFLTR